MWLGGIGPWDSHRLRQAGKYAKAAHKRQVRLDRDEARQQFIDQLVVAQQQAEFWRLQGWLAAWGRPYRQAGSALEWKQFHVGLDHYWHYQGWLAGWSRPHFRPVDNNTRVLKMFDLGQRYARSQGAPERLSGPSRSADTA